MIELKAQSALDEAQTAIIRDTQLCAQSLGVALFLIGATARVLLLEHVYGFESTRATRDVDFAVAVDSWEIFEQLKAKMVATGKFSQIPNIEHRLNYLNAPGMWIDIVPYGGIANEAALIRWPGDNGKQMNVAGFVEAFHSAVKVKINENTHIAVVSLAGLMLLKLNAWLDRDSTAKQLSDAQDIATLLKSYERTGLDDRIYAESTPLEKYRYDVRCAGAWLLGQDVKTICSHSPTPRKAVLQAFKVAQRTKLIQQLATEFTSSTPLEDASTLLQCFEHGFLS